jgi:hypothetical protein
MTVVADECGYIDPTASNLSLFYQTNHLSLYLSYGPPWAHYLGGYQDRLLGGPLGLPDLCCTVPVGARRKYHGGEVLG